MSKTGIYVCNYNKREYVIRCVESLLKQTFRDRDIYVVDNASTDGSSEALEERFCGQISVIKNKENIGGSGGFDAAIQDALEKDYQYVVLCDNDVWVDTDTIQVMHEYMEKHPDVGILGPKVLQMEKPKLIQDFGGSIDKRYHLTGNYTGRIDENLPDELDCEYISTCTAMARVSAVRKFGSMPKENFIYWDDVEWSKRCQNSGYRTVAIGSARVWHNFAEADIPSPFMYYYMTRNQLKFFSKFLPSSDISAFFETMLTEIHAKCFMFRYKKRIDLSKTIQNAWEDFLAGAEGRAGEGRILQKPENPGEDSLETLFHDNASVVVEINGEQDEAVTLIRLAGRMKKIGSENRICIRVRDMEKLKAYLASYADENLYDKLEIKQWNDQYDKEARSVCLCDDIKGLSAREENKAYIDRFLNCIVTEEDYKYIQNYEASFKSFRETYKGMFEDRIRQLREIQI